MSQPSSEHPSPSSARVSRRVRTAILAGAGAIAVLAAGYFGARYLRFSLAHEETDDAQVDGDISPVLPRISGYVTAVLVRDNQRVAAGDPLVRIDSRELDLRRDQAADALKSAEASWVTAKADLADARAAEAVARANAVTAEVTRDKTAADLKRDQALYGNGAITVSQLNDSRAAAAVAAARLEAASREAEAAGSQAAETETRIGAARAVIDQRQSDVAYANLERSYAVLTAPIAGLVSHKSVEPGQYVQAGQTLLSVASDANVWVVANFKETQLGKMRPGEAAEFTVDSYPGARFDGRVDSMGGATGARFALLPPDNASGNFVKVTQRVPVKIVITHPPGPGRVLRPGMSVDVAVGTEN